jgi:hypothetical protein
MKRSFFSAACAAGALLLISLVGSLAQTVAVAQAAALAQEQPASQRIAAAANAFLGTLDAGQRQKVLSAFDDAEQRKRW